MFEVPITPMPFSKLELEAIDRLIGRLCRRRSLENTGRFLRYVYEVEGHSVSIYEILLDDDPEWEEVRMGSARLRYNRSRDEWRLYCMRRDRKWHLYDLDVPVTDLASLVRIIDEDEYGAFFS